MNVPKMWKRALVTSVVVTMAFSTRGVNACTSFLLGAENGEFGYGRTMEFALALRSTPMVM